MLEEVMFDATKELVSTYLGVLSSRGVEVTEGQMVRLFEDATKVAGGSTVMTPDCEYCEHVQIVANALVASPQIQRVKELGTQDQVRSCYETATALLSSCWETTQEKEEDV